MLFISVAKTISCKMTCDNNVRLIQFFLFPIQYTFCLPEVQHQHRFWTSRRKNRKVISMIGPLCTTYFKFNGDFYQQTDGVAMEGPTSAIVSEIYMQSLETTAITTADHPPKVWERHVDDVYSIVHKTYLQELLEHINSLHPQIQFTKEEENNSSLPFLAILVQ